MTPGQIDRRFKDRNCPLVPLVYGHQIPQEKAMPASIRPVADERDGLLTFLAQQRYYVRIAAHGLSDEQAAATPSASALSVGGIIKHLVGVERTWIARAQGKTPEIPDWEGQFRLGEGETLAEWLDTYAAVAADTESIVSTLDLEQPVPVPRDAPWWPKDVEAWSIRWVLLHLIQETARHAGHADIVRESLDGQTAWTLMAAAERWPADWMQTGNMTPQDS
jgi:uncharacterized damage-inducible protein DinB